MCIRDSLISLQLILAKFELLMNLDHLDPVRQKFGDCLLYTSDAADDLLCVDLGGRRIIKKKWAGAAILDFQICEN